jgi:hypothetical protein
MKASEWVWRLVMALSSAYTPSMLFTIFWVPVLLSLGHDARYRIGTGQKESAAEPAIIGAS